MAEKTKKHKLKIDVYKDDKTTDNYEGRLVCALDDEQFNSVLKKAELAKKIFTKESLPLSALSLSASALGGSRLLFAVRKKNGKDIHRKRFFITEKLDFVSHFDMREKEVALSGENCWINLSAKKEEEKND